MRCNLDTGMYYLEYGCSSRHGCIASEIANGWSGNRIGSVFFMMKLSFYTKKMIRVTLP